MSRGAKIAGLLALVLAAAIFFGEPQEYDTLELTTGTIKINRIIPLTESWNGLPLLIGVLRIEEAGSTVLFQ